MKNLHQFLLQKRERIPGFLRPLYNSLILGDLGRYTVIGVSTTLINYGIYLIFSFNFDINALEGARQSAILWWANGTAWFISVTFAFFGNRNFVFRAKNVSRGRRIHQWISFYGWRGLSGFLETVLLNILVTLGSLHDMAAKLLATLFAMLVNYLSGKYCTFRKPRKDEKQK
ncbi:MAG: hypothetical protein DBX52_00005 [Clostridiales bacterium]|nr:MAG: hypothetical protein DBX52_00005 [Clostridiales bacterium]